MVTEHEMKHAMDELPEVWDMDQNARFAYFGDCIIGAHPNMPPIIWIERYSEKWADLVMRNMNGLSDIGCFIRSVY